MLKNRKKLKCGKCNSDGKKSFMIKYNKYNKSMKRETIVWKCLICGFRIIGGKQ